MSAMEMDVTAPVLPGETLAGKYRIERVLGKGGMGIVVAARHLDLDERVAIKFMLRHDDPVALERFVREARAAVKVKSEHVCRVLDVGRLDSGEPYLVMEYLEGTDLARLLARDRTVSVSQVAGWVIEACAALAEAHALGIVHRDLKPANLFLATRPNGATSRLKVIDFGISKLIDADAMTSTSATMGSPAYMSPEQIVSSRDVDARSDVWSLGVIMYELVTGAVPFAAETLIQLSVKIRETEPAPLTSVAPDIAPGFAAIVEKCVRKNANDRYDSVSSLAAALVPFAGREGVRAAETMAHPVVTAALVGTEPDHSRSPYARSVSAPPPSKDVVTLEPLSRVSGAEGAPTPTRARARGWASAGAVGVAVVGLVLASRRCNVELTAAAPDANLGVQGEPSRDRAQIETASLPSPSPSPSLSANSSASAPPSFVASATTAPSASGSAVRHGPSPAMPRAMIDTPRIVDAGAPPSPPSTTVSTSPDAGKAKRSLDRTDPYE